MAGQRYSGKIVHTEKTIETLYRTQYYSYDKARILIRLGIGLACVISVFLATLPTWAKALLLLVGAWLIVSKDFPAQIRADRVLQERKSALPQMNYVFYDDHMSVSGEGSMNIGYQKLQRLVEDDRYFYLFLSRDSVCMMDRESLTPKKPEDFHRFLENQSGLHWRREKSLLTMNLSDLRLLLADLRQK